MQKIKLDSIDRKLLELLQADAEIQVADLAAQVGLSATPCWRRVQRLKEAGVIKRQVVLVDRDKVNVGVTVFVAVRTSTIGSPANRTPCALPALTSRDQAIGYQ